MEYNLKSSKALNLGQLGSVTMSPYPGFLGEQEGRGPALGLLRGVIPGRVRHLG